MKTNKKMIEMVSPKETILGLDIITVREKKNKRRLHYPTLTISTVINKIFIKTENTTASTHYVNTYHIIEISYMYVQDTRR